MVANLAKPRFLFLVLVLLTILGATENIAAQSTPFVVTMSKIESQAFPQVTAYVYATDRTGRPVTDLTSADFLLTEDGIPVDPANIISVESVSISGLQLVLGIDLSTPVNNLGQVKNAAKTFVDTLQPDEQLALLVFYDQVVLAVDFTNDTRLLKTAIDALDYTGNYTAVEETTSKAATMVASRSAARKAVILVPDIKNNIYNVPTGQALQQAQAARVPIYLISFPVKAQPGDFQNIAAQVEGAVEIFLPDAGQVQAKLLEIGSQLRQGYRITYRSVLQSDNAEHMLTVTANYQGNRAQAQGKFVAVSNQVLVSLPDLTDGQSVSGTVSVTPQIIAVVPVSSVTYLLDDAPLQSVTTPPFTLNWDTTTTTVGMRTLTAQATDQAGNQGQADVRLDVQPPLAVTVAASSNEITIGDTVTVQANIYSIAEVARVNVLLDGELLDSDEATPTELSFSSNNYQPGRHLVSVQAEDSLGNVAMDSVEIEFLAPPPPPPSKIWWWLRLMSVIFIIIMALLLLLILALIIFRTRRKTHNLALTFSNESNIANRYKLRAEDSARALEFQFALQGAMLPAAMAPPMPALRQAAPNGQPASGPVDASFSLPPAGADTSSYPATSTDASVGAVQESPRIGAANPSQALGQTQKKLGCIATAITPFITLLSVLSAFLPGSIATPIQNWVSQVQSVQGTAAGAVSRTKTQVDSTQQAFEGAGQQVSAMTPAAAETQAVSTPTPAAIPSPEPAAVSAGPSTPSAGGGPVHPAAGPTYHPIQATQTTGVPWAVTPLLDPGRNLTIDLLITPFDPNRSREYVFKVISVLVNQEDLPPVVEEGTIEIKKPFWLTRLARVVLYLFLATLIIASTALISLWLLQFSIFDLPLLENWVWWS